ncbi:MAG TPA: DsrE/DsrF/DrsH-like family protein [Thermoplasmata archaeon]|nr:DsrE/DsrF/DrsH-like family protein [Thermoplasmata archaeon]
MQDRLSLVVFSGTVDKLYPVAIMASGAVALGKDVEIFVTFYGLEAFRKGQPQKNMKMDANYPEIGPMMMKVMMAKKMPSWYDMLRQAKEMGNIKVHACATTYDLMDMKKEDLDPIVDDVIGVTEFLSRASEGGITLFL